MGAKVIINVREKTFDCLGKKDTGREPMGVGCRKKFHGLPG